MSRRNVQLWVGLVAATVYSLINPVGARAQDPLANAPLAPGSVISSDANDKPSAGSTIKTDPKAQAKAEPEFVVKTDAEWRKLLTRTQYAVTRQKATEAPFSGKYATGHFKGTFLCVCCDAPLFEAEAKFESGTGWPSFDRPAGNRAIVTAWDYSDIEPRVEVMCRRCRAHLGHLFDDGPTPTSLRYCLNSVALKLKALEPETGRKAAATKTASQTKSKAKATQGAKSASKSIPTDDPVNPVPASESKGARSSPSP